MMMDSEERHRSILRQLRITQVLATIAIGGCVVMTYVHQSKSLRDESNEPSETDHLRVAHGAQSSIDMFSNVTLSSVTLRAIGHSALFGVDGARNVVKVGASGKASIELRFNTDTGEVTLARQKDARADVSTEIVTQIAAPIVQY